jgi:sulfur-oxidizing protein SoxY
MTLPRRLFLIQATAGTAGLALAAGLLTPRRLLAEWPADLFAAQPLEVSLRALTGGEPTAPGPEIAIEAPAEAADGRSVFVTVSARVPDLEGLSLLVAENTVPLVAQYRFGPDAENFVAMRVKLAKTSDVVAVARAGGRFLEARRHVKVPEGQGCVS